MELKRLGKKLVLKNGTIKEDQVCYHWDRQVVRN